MIYRGSARDVLNGMDWVEYHLWKINRLRSMTGPQLRKQVKPWFRADVLAPLAGIKPLRTVPIEECIKALATADGRSAFPGFYDHPTHCVDE